MEERRDGGEMEERQGERMGERRRAKAEGSEGEVTVRSREEKRIQRGENAVIERREEQRSRGPGESMRDIKGIRV